GDVAVFDVDVGALFGGEVDDFFRGEVDGRVGGNQFKVVFAAQLQRVVLGLDIQFAPAGREVEADALGALRAGDEADALVGVQAQLFGDAEVDVSAAAEVQGFAGAVVQRLAGDADDAGATGECGDGIAAVRDGAARFGVGIVVAGDRVGDAFPECLERRGLVAQCALPACGGAFMTGQCG